MKTYIKKPIPIRAVQFNLGNALSELLKEGAPIRADKGLVFVDTNHGLAQIKPGDWVILTDAGEFYPCTDEEFQKNYSEATE